MEVVQSGPACREKHKQKLLGDILPRRTQLSGRALHDGMETEDGT